MNKQEFEFEKKIEELRHKNKMIEIEAHKTAKIEAERQVLDFKLQLHRIQRADRMRERR